MADRAELTPRVTALTPDLLDERVRGLIAQIAQALYGVADVHVMAERRIVWGVRYSWSGGSHVTEYGEELYARAWRRPDSVNQREELVSREILTIEGPWTVRS